MEANSQLMDDKMRQLEWDPKAKPVDIEEFEYWAVKDEHSVLIKQLKTMNAVIDDLLSATPWGSNETRFPKTAQQYWVLPFEKNNKVLDACLGNQWIQEKFLKREYDRVCVLRSMLQDNDVYLNLCEKKIKIEAKMNKINSNNKALAKTVKLQKLKLENLDEEWAI